MTSNHSILFILLTILNSCTGQTLTKDVKSTSVIMIGDTVQELGLHLMVVFQDQKNNYWFGSFGEGVYRFDGKTIIHLTTKHGLSNDSISKIEEDKSGNIYFTTAKGICKFDGQTMRKLDAVKTSVPEREWKLEPDDLWFKGDQDSGVVYRYDGKNLYRLEFPRTKEGEEYIDAHPRSKFPYMNGNPYDVYSIYKDRRGNIWFGTGSLGVCRYDGKSFFWISEDELNFGDLAYGIRSTIEDNEGKFWFSNTMYRYEFIPPALPWANGSQANTNQDSKKIIEYKKEKGIGNSKEHDPNDFTYFLSSIKDSIGNLWIVTYSAGVWKFDPSVLLHHVNTNKEINSAMKDITHYSIKDGDKTVTLFTIFKDNQNVLWLGTHENGVYRFNGTAFERFQPLINH